MHIPVNGDGREGEGKAERRDEASNQLKLINFAVYKGKRVTISLAGMKRLGGDPMLPLHMQGE